MKLFKSLNKRLLAAATVAAALLIGGTFAVNANVNADTGMVAGTGMPKITDAMNSFGVLNLRVGAHLYPFADGESKGYPMSVTSKSYRSVYYSVKAFAGKQTFYYLMGMDTKGSNTRNTFFAYVNAKDVTVPSVGKVHVNYNKHYGIQIWNKQGNPVKTSKGTNKKLAGQSNWKVYNETQFMSDSNKPVYTYNLGGDQYIEAKYVTFTVNNAYKKTFNRTMPY